ncbi:MAG: NAD(P)H-hydrate dehydratase [Pyrinomonadaceae bacterium]
MSPSHRNKSAAANALLITPRLLRAWPLPRPDEAGDKETRGRVLVVGGSAEMPGAVVLAATAAARAGAGKLQIATCQSVAAHIAVAVPEARVFALPETRTGALAASGVERISEHINEARGVLVGPGMLDEGPIARCLKKLLAHVHSSSVLVLDANALTLLARAPESLRQLRGRVVLTPHAEEMGELLNCDKATVERARTEALRKAVVRFNAVVLLKGRETLIAAPGSRVYVNRAGNIGLATSGSGDTLAGLIVGLAARGAAPLQAAVYGVYLHARAGELLAKRHGLLGYLARELSDEVPALMDRLCERR